MTITSPTYLNRVAFWDVVFLFGSPLALAVISLVPTGLPLAVPVALFLIGLAVVEFGLMVYYARWKLVVHTNNSKYTFVSQSDDLKKIPQAVRGAES